MDSSSAPSPVVTRLRCDGLQSPLGVENHTPHLSWQLSGLARQRAFQLRVASRAELLKAPDFWESGRVASSHSIAVPYAGKVLPSRQRLWWQVRVWDENGRESDWSVPSWWEMGLLREDDFQAQWIGRQDATWFGAKTPVLPAPYFRRAFEVPDDAVTARARVSGMGYFELFLNGKRVGDHVLDPIVTQYERRVSYVTHDVSAFLQPGKNSLGVMLGNGWYNSHTSDAWNFDTASWRDYPKLWMQLEITRANGSLETVVTDSSWRVAEGSLRFDGLRNGEHYDARAEIDGWNTLDFDDSGWKNAAVVADLGGHLVSQTAPPCRVLETLEPKHINEVRPGVWVFDFGVNIAGWTRLQTRGASGDEIVLRHAERVLPNGEIDAEHIAQFVKSGEFQTDRYLLRGEGDETFEPRFTYHGFQWVQVEGLRETPTPQTLQARVVASDFASAGRFTCSNETLNALQNITRRAYQGNFVGLPTDCPHREKNGWTADAWLACETGLWNFDAAPSYVHWLQSIEDTQRASGQLPGIVPTGGWGFNWGSGPAWDGAFLGIPWQIYRFTGDTTILERHYAAQKRYLQWAFSLLDGGLMRYGLGDWNAPDQNATAPRDLVATAITVDLAQMLVAIAEVLGHTNDAACWKERALSLRQAWRNAFLQPAGRVSNDEQTSLACALELGLLEHDERPDAVERLRASIRASNGRPTFGIWGAKWVPRALSNAGLANEAFDLITGEGFPGWAHWLAQGATTLWESWCEEGSRNHVMFGDISAWMFEFIGGLRPLEGSAGFRCFEVSPQFVPQLEWANIEHLSPYGTIRVAWNRGPRGLELEVVVPGNSEARLTLPESEAAQILGPGTHTLSVARGD